ncbi:hypothetical protein LZ554_002256 [Drepanopeziza brunnea f. sp. 'monogermtubi']|nr:hypothetical protein LZ554_002256 [Drepanopeziza brunnea f. sp. 'monogermtubi']
MFRQLQSIIGSKPPPKKETQEHLSIPLEDLKPAKENTTANQRILPLPSLEETLRNFHATEPAPPPGTSSTSPEGMIYVHVIRHAEVKKPVPPSTLQDRHQLTRNTTQALHNAIVVREERRALPDPRLTEKGIRQAEFLREIFPYHDDATIFLSSPMSRTLETTLICFEKTIREKGLKIIAMDDLREWGAWPCNTGSKISTLLQEFPALEDTLEAALVPENWRKNWENPLVDPAFVATRVARVKAMLWTLGQMALSGGGEWEKGVRVPGKGVKIPGVEEDKDCHIVVVSHGGFLATLMGESKQMFNTQMKTLVATKEGDVVLLEKFLDDD